MSSQDVRQVYRNHAQGPLTSIDIIPGAVVVSMEFDIPGAHTPLHEHTFDHWLECVFGSALVTIGQDVQKVQAGDRFLVKARALHSVLSMETGTLVRCVHNHADIHPDNAPEGIPVEWLHRLTVSKGSLNHAG